MADEFVLDTPVVRALVADVQAGIAGAASPTDACEAIRPRFAELLADPDWLAPEYRVAAPESGMGGGIGQRLLYRAGARNRIRSGPSGRKSRSSAEAIVVPPLPG